jgi:hypothetical protein
MKHFYRFLSVIFLSFVFATAGFCDSKDLESKLKKITIMTPSPDIRSELWDPWISNAFPMASI